MKEPKDHGHKVAVQRALDAYNRARGGYIDRQTCIIYLLESLERDWNRLNGDLIGVHPLVPSFEQMTRAAHRMAQM